MPEKRNSKFFFLEDFFFADQPTRFCDRPATRNKLFPKVALIELQKMYNTTTTTNQCLYGINHGL